MRDARRPAALALLALCVGLTAFNIASLIVPGTELLDDRPDAFTAFIFALIFSAFPLVGVIIALRRPEHPIGWLLMTIGLMLTVAVFSTEYTGRAVILGWALPAADFVAWLGTWSWFVAAGIALPLAIALFPSGHFPGRRTRTAFRVLTVLVVVTGAAYSILPGDLESWEGKVRNPFGVGGPVGDVARAVSELGTPVLTVVSALAVGTLAYRIRRGVHEERQQLKWLLLPAMTFVGGITASAVSMGVEPANTISWTVALIGLASFPVAAGIAILRYRLFDIDVVIRRTLVYSLVVAVLAAVYVTLVLALQTGLSGLTGGGTLPVALSTLAIAGLFGPVRRRVRAAVDQRFYRSRYDAAGAVAGLGMQLRDEVELDAVGQRLIRVASQTVRPTRVGLWVRSR